MRPLSTGTARTARQFAIGAASFAATAVLILFHAQGVAGIA